MAFEDLTGQKFGRLTAIERAEDYVISSGRHYPTWKCRCDCGNEIVAHANALKRGATTSCECLTKELRKAHTEKILDDLIGQKFNHLTVIEKAPPKIDAYGKAEQQVVCLCDCGNKRIVPVGSLRANNIKSCGNCEYTGSRLIDLTGQRFGKLTVIKRVENYVSPKGLKFSQWLCKCDCGNEAVVRSIHLRSGYVKSCGCLHTTQDGNTKKRLWKVWDSMIRRCESDSDKSWNNYGGRGISVCEEWHDYNTFEKWALENGYDPVAKRSKCTIDRIDVNGDYCPENCRWVDQLIQANNTRRNKYLTYCGEKHTYSEWGRIYNVLPGYISKKVREGLSAEEILNPLEEEKNKECLVLNTTQSENSL